MTITEGANVGGFRRVDADPHAGAITGAEGGSWLVEVADAATGCLFWAVSTFAVGGVRHSPSGATCTAQEEDQ